MSNYYTSVALFEELEDGNTLACVTVRSNRSGKGMCSERKKVKPLNGEESLFRQKGSVTCMTWHDKAVNVFATTATSTRKTDQSVVQHSVKVNRTW